MKNLAQIKELIIRCYKKSINKSELSITVYKECDKGVEPILWRRADNTPTVIDSVYIYKNYYIVFNLSSTGTASIMVYNKNPRIRGNIKLQISFENNSSRLSVYYDVMYGTESTI